MSETIEHACLDLLQSFSEKLSLGVIMWQYEDARFLPENMRLVYSNPKADCFLNINVKDFWGQTMQEIFPDFLMTGIPEQFSDIMRQRASRKIGPFMYEDDLIGKNYYTLEATPLDDLTVGILFENVTEQNYFKEAWKEEIKKRIEKLTARETEILEEIVLAKKSKEIAEKFNVALRTVETHRTHILSKMQASSSVELTAIVTKFRN